MPTPKTWTAVDIEADKVQLWVDDSGNLRVERHYVFVDEEGAQVPVAGGLLSESVPWVDVPEEIRDALTTINTWTLDQILQQEGMADV
jgi:hypothetical protein